VLLPGDYNKDVEKRSFLYHSEDSRD